MTSIKAPPAAPADPKNALSAGLTTQDDLKASATSGNDEPTNSSSAASLNPSTKKDKPQREEPKADCLEAEADSESLPVASTTLTTTLTNERSKDCAKETDKAPVKQSKRLTMHDLRKLARKPGAR